MVKMAADIVTEANAGVGFSELVDRITMTDLAEVWSCVQRRRAHIHKTAA
jgi:hypothetical protein